MYVHTCRTYKDKKLPYAAGQQEVGAKKIAKKTVKDLWWKRRLDKGIKRLRKDLGIIGAWQTDE